ncbi:p-nitrophenyl phosphatase [Saitoella coloradoensis]
MTTKAQKITTKEQADAFLAKFDVFLFDCDGVLWSGNTLLPKVADTIAMLKKQGKQVVFVTNNSTKSRAAYKKKLDSMGIPAEVNDIFGSAYSAAVYINRVLNFPKDKKVYVLGESGIEEELESEGVRYCGGTDPEERRAISLEDYDAIGPDSEVGAVLCGLDTHVNYLKLAKAHAYLQDPNVLFLQTNDDSTYPSHGKLFPGAGSIAAPLKYSTRREATALGKPNQSMMDAIASKFQFDRSKACMVGDRLNTDIQFGLKGGLGGTLLVLTGVSKVEEIQGDDAPIVPHYYADKLGDLYSEDTAN